MTSEIPCTSDKQIAFDALHRMPDTATLEEISEEIAILATIKRGEADADAGRTMTHEDFKRESATWIGK